MSVSEVLNRLGGVYRDPTRVSRDASNLISNKNGRALRPSIADLVENDGTHHPRVLSLSGTIAMTYRGTKYNIPVDIYLPPAYPYRPPLCYVRPVSSMVLKENHRHVGRDGMVFMPYLHEWRQHTSNLVEMVIMMSSIFGNDPPVYAKPPGSVASSNPPRYDQLQRDRREREEQQQRVDAEARERLEREQAAAAMAASRASAEAERRELEDMRNRLTSKLQSYLQEYYNGARTEIQSELRDQARLDRNKNAIAEQVLALKNARQALTTQTTDVEEKTTKIKENIVSAEKDKEEGGEPDVDNLAVPTDIQSQQMLELVSKNASITDCLYFLDKALVKGNLTLETHLKSVRLLAKKQFMARAHMMKIAQIQQKREQRTGTF